MTPRPGRTKPPSGSGPDVQTARGLHTDKNGTQSELSAEDLGHILIVLNLRLLGIWVFEKLRRKRRSAVNF